MEEQLCSIAYLPQVRGSCWEAGGPGRLKDQRPVQHVCHFQHTDLIRRYPAACAHHLQVGFAVRVEGGCLAAHLEEALPDFQFAFEGGASSEVRRSPRFARGSFPTSPAAGGSPASCGCHVAWPSSGGGWAMMLAASPD